MTKFSQIKSTTNISKSSEKSKKTIRKKLGDIKPLPMKNIKVFKKLPVKIEDIIKILNIPFNKKEYNDNILKSLLFNEYTSNYEENIELLKKHIEKGKYGNYKDYYIYLDKIRSHLDKYDIYEIVNEIKNDESDTCYNELKSQMRSYDPLNMSFQELIKFKNCLFSNKCITLYDNIIKYEFKNAIINSTSEKITKKTLKKYLEENKFTYYAIKFVTNIINFMYSNILNGNIIEKIELIHILADDHNNILVNNPRIDISYNTSKLSNSSSLESKSYIRVKRNKEREVYLDYLKNNRGYNNEINEEDIITFDRWDEMPLSKLRYVIKISYVDNNKNFCHAFNAKALYKLWKVNHYNNEIFKNPFSQKPFAEEDKNIILITLGKRDFRYDSDDDYTSAINARYDVVFNKSRIKINGINYWEIKISYLIKKGLRVYKSKSITLELLRINIRKDMKYIDNLLKKIYSLHETNKILGKFIPFKVHPAFDKYNLKIIDNKDDYRDFFDMIFTKY